MMTSERWEQVKQIYDSVLKCAAGQRAAFLKQACAGDQELRREVESLLAYEEGAEDFIKTPALEVAARLLAHEPPPALAGREISHYKILSLLGAGGMGEVYLAEDLQLRRKVALKLLPARFTQDAERLQRFEREARTASSLNHPNIVTIHEIGQVDDLHYIVTEYIDGQTLRQVLSTQMKPTAALDVAVQVASALSAAHEAGIVHRDIKPENLMLRPDGLVKVLDFGIAKLTERHSPTVDADAITTGIKTETGVLMGTTSYMSPEQARGMPVDSRTDLFSLGVVIYEMIAGFAPFEGETTSDRIAAILEREPPPLALYSKEVPEALQRIVTKALRKDREERYQTAKELLTDLKSLKQRLEFEAELGRSMGGDARATASGGLTDRQEKRTRQRIRYLRTSDGVQLAWAEAGAGPVLVKAANWLSHLEYEWESPVWRHWMRFFSDHFRFVRYDERGCGMSDWNTGDLSFERWVVDLEAVVEAAEIPGPFVLLGISQGAATAIAYAVRHPERVSKLILYGGYARGIWRRGDPEAERVFRAIIDLASFGWGKDNPAFRHVFTSRFIPGATSQQMDWFNDLCRKTTTGEIAAALLNARASVDVTELLPRVQTPTLVLHSRDESVAPISEAHLMAAGIPGAQFVELDSKNHILLENEPAWERLREAVLEFMGSEHSAHGEDQETIRNHSSYPGRTAAVTAKDSVQAGAVAAAQTRSSAGYHIVSQIKGHKKAAGFVLVMFLTALASAFFYFNQASALTERDTILLADFVNTTGDAVFDGTLKQALAAHLEQSPFLNIFPDQRVRETLRYMDRSPDERVTPEIALEICQRQNIKAMLTGSISSLGSHYAILLEATNAFTGDALGREQAEAESKEQVLRKLGEAASKLRGRLGESLSLIEKFNAPLEQATTSSLEALKAYSFGREQASRGRFFEAIPFYKRAVELDPNFAQAYIGLATAHVNVGEYDLAAQFSEKAFELRERTSEREKFNISSRYYWDVLHNEDKTIEVLELWKETYQRDFVPRTNLGDRYYRIGQYEKGIEELRESIRLNPDGASAYGNLALCLMSLNRHDDAKAIIEQGLARKLEANQFHHMLYSIAFLAGDTAAMQREVDWAAGKSAEAGMLVVQSAIAGAAGQLRKARAMSGRASDMSQRLGLKEAAAQTVSEAALRDAIFGNCREVKASADKTLAIGRSRYSLGWNALALALCGEANRAQLLADEMANRFPQDTDLNTNWVPLIRATIEIDRDNPAQAIQLLQSASRFEMGTNALYWPAYIRGLAHLRGREGNEAMVEFQKIIDHRSVLVPKDNLPLAYSLYPVAYLGLARGAALAGDAAKSLKAYQDFFALWKDADPDIPILQQAQQEVQKLK